jgi:hypothetical protein
MNLLIQFSPTAGDLLPLASKYFPQYSVLYAAEIYEKPILTRSQIRVYAVNRTMEKHKQLFLAKCNGPYLKCKVNKATMGKYN